MEPSVVAADIAPTNDVANNEKQKQFLMSLNFNDKFYKCEQSQLRKSTASIIENIGFATASNSVISTLTFLLKTYFEQLCHDSKELAIHDRRDFIILDDVAEVFKYHSINLSELHDYVHQVGRIDFSKPLPLFPISAPLIMQTEVGSEQENLVEKNCNAEKEDDNIKEIDVTKLDQKKANIQLSHCAQRAFPDFADNFAEELGFTVQQFISPVEEINYEPDLIQESVNLSATITLDIKRNNLTGPVFNTKAIYDKERNKEKKKKKKEKRQQMEKSMDQTKLTNKEKEYSKKSEVYALSNEVQQQLKVPKIKIRIGPAPASTTTPITDATEFNLTKLPSTIPITDVPIPPSNSNVIQQQDTDVIINSAEKSQINDFSTQVILPILNKNLPIGMQPEKPISSPLIVPTLKIVKSPSPEKVITELTKNQSDKIFKSIKEQLHKIPPSSNSTKQFNTPTSVVQNEMVPCNLKPQQTKKRSRKCAKPTRVDPLLIKTLEASPPPIPVRPSKAMESLVSTKPKKQSEVTEIFPTETKVKKNTIVAIPAELKSGKNACKDEQKTTSNSLGKSVKSKPVIINTVPSPELVEEEEDIWICPICSVAYVENGPDMVACDQCDRWYHWSCVGILLAPPENAKWYCAECKRLRKKQQQNASNNDGEGVNSRKSSIGAPPTKKQRQNR